MLDRVRSEHGAEANIVSADLTRSGGVAGFFARETFEVVVEIIEHDEPERPSRHSSTSSTRSASTAEGEGRSTPRRAARERTVATGSVSTGTEMRAPRPEPRVVPSDPNRSAAVTDRPGDLLHIEDDLADAPPPPVFEPAPSVEPGDFARLLADLIDDPEYHGDDSSVSPTDAAPTAPTLAAPTPAAPTLAAPAPTLAAPPAVTPEAAVTIPEPHVPIAEVVAPLVQPPVVAAQVVAPLPEAPIPPVTASTIPTGPTIPAGPTHEELAAVGLNSGIDTMRAPRRTMAEPTDTSPVSLGELIPLLDQLIVAAPALPQTGVLAVVGPRADAVEVAVSLANSMGRSAAEVMIAAPSDSSVTPQTIATVVAESAKRREIRGQNGPVIVAVAVMPGIEGHRWAAETLSVISPSQTRMAVAGWRPLDRLAQTLEALPVVHVLDIIEIDGAVTPEAFLRVGPPVATVDGQASTATLWAALLMECGRAAALTTLTQRPIDQ